MLRWVMGPSRYLYYKGDDEKGAGFKLEIPVFEWTKPLASLPSISGFVLVQNRTEVNLHSPDSLAILLYWLNWNYAAELCVPYTTVRLLSVLQFSGYWLLLFQYVPFHFLLYSTPASNI